MDFAGRFEKATASFDENQAETIDKTLEKANTALADKEWALAAALFQQVSLKATRLAAHAMGQELKLLKGATNGPQEG